MCNAIITYYRTVRFKLDIVRYASRNPKLFFTSFRHVLPPPSS